MDDKDSLQLVILHCVCWLVVAVLPVVVIMPWVILVLYLADMSFSVNGLVVTALTIMLITISSYVDE